MISRIRRLLKDIKDESCALHVRNYQYHGGRLNTESLMEDYTNRKMEEIYSIKRELVKLGKESKHLTNYWKRNDFKNRIKK